MASTYYEDRRGKPQLLHIDAHAPYVDGPSGLIGGRDRTDDLTWANKFRRNDSQLTQSDITGVSPATSPVSPVTPVVPQPQGITGGILGEIFNNPFARTFAQQGGVAAAGSTPQPTLSSIAQSGINHAQTWMQQAQNGAQRVAPYMQRNSLAKTSYGGTDLRRPYIAGAEDMTSKFVAGGRFSQYKVGSDPTLDPSRFSFASAFR